jgi:cytoskeletal protein CcmA (bactofilin family)
VRIDCRFTGDITSDGKLILGREAVFEGTVSVKELVVHGILNGEALVASRTILHQNAKFTGTLSSPALIMEEGALLQGQLIMNRETGKGKKIGTADPLGPQAQAEHGMTFADAAVKQ